MAPAPAYKLFFNLPYTDGLWTSTIDSYESWTISLKKPSKPKDENLWNSHWCLIRTHHMCQCGINLFKMGLKKMLGDAVHLRPEGPGMRGNPHIKAFFFNHEFSYCFLVSIMHQMTCQEYSIQLHSITYPVHQVPCLYDLLRVLFIFSGGAPVLLLWI